MSILTERAIMAAIKLYFRNVTERIEFYVPDTESSKVLDALQVAMHNKTTCTIYNSQGSKIIVDGEDLRVVLG